jgi:hypothetical protein
MAVGIKLPEVVSSHLLEAWLLMALIIYPFTMKIIRV